MKNIQDNVTEALADNQNAISQVANHINQQTYHDGRIRFVPYDYINYKDALPDQPSANITTST